jgi:hypothetical protein
MTVRFKELGFAMITKSKTLVFDIDFKLKALESDMIAKLILLEFNKKINKLNECLIKFNNTIKN